MTLAADHSKAVVLTLLIHCFMLLPLFVGIHCLVLVLLWSYFSFSLVPFLGLQPSWRGREDWLLYFVGFLDVWWLLIFCGSFSLFRGLVHSLRLWYFLIILTCFFRLLERWTLLLSPFLLISILHRIMAYSYGFLFDCTTVGKTLESMAKLSVGWCMMLAHGGANKYFLCLYGVRAVFCFIKVW